MLSILMHKDIEVAVVECEDGQIIALKEILNPLHMPIGTYTGGMSMEFVTVYLQAWQTSRVIPFDRENGQEVFERTGKDRYVLSGLSHGMAFTDQYWIKDRNENMSWNELTFHNLGFQESLLSLNSHGEFSPSPDFSTNGCLSKSWILLDNIPVLIKASPNWLPTASANEVVASQLAQLCDIDHATYFPLRIKDKLYCVSPCFITSEDEDFVPMSNYNHINRGQGKRYLEKMLSEDFINTMTAFDLLIGNTDRHEGNFGYIVNANDMSFVRPAPLFDSGMCLHYWLTKNSSFKPFFTSREKALQNVKTIPFPIPCEDILRNVVEDVYEMFGLRKSARAASDELVANARQLKEKRGD